MINEGMWEWGLAFDAALGEERAGDGGEHGDGELNNVFPVDFHKLTFLIEN